MAACANLILKMLFIFVLFKKCEQQLGIALVWQDISLKEQYFFSEMWISILLQREEKLQHINSSWDDKGAWNNL